MRLATLVRRWSILLLVLAFSAGLAGPAFASSLSNGHHTAMVLEAHDDCHAPAVDAGQDDLDTQSLAALAEVDCALTHLGHAVLDCPVPYAISAAPYAYPAYGMGKSLGQVPGLEGDPPRPARSV